MRETVLEAVLRSADAPSEAQRNRFAAFLKKQYGQEVPLRWEQDPALEKGFRMEVGADLYDWSLELTYHILFVCIPKNSSARTQPNSCLSAGTVFL